MNYKMDTPKMVEIYTDGACSGNPGLGGWGAILIYKSSTKEIAGFEENTTNNRMEMLAAIKALELLKEPCDVKLYSDSAYLVNTFIKNWISSWKSNNWHNKSGHLIKNKDLWLQLDVLHQIHTISWIKVAGHANNELNNRCDFLATQQIKIRKQGQTNYAI